MSNIVCSSQLVLSAWVSLCARLCWLQSAFAVDKARTVREMTKLCKVREGERTLGGRREGGWEERSESDKQE